MYFTRAQHGINIRSGEVVYLDMGGMVRAPVDVWPLEQTAESVERAYNTLLVFARGGLTVRVSYTRSEVRRLQALLDGSLVEYGQLEKVLRLELAQSFSQSIPF